jgi:branched-chain amino acid transport system permease protein
VPAGNSVDPASSFFDNSNAAAVPRCGSGTAFVTTVWFGLSDGAIYALVAIGFDIVITASGVLNFAQGATVMFASFIGFQTLSEMHLPIALAILICAAIGGVIGGLTERIAIWPLSFGRPWRGTHAELITTVGVATILAGLAGLKWGYNPLSVPFPGSQTTIPLLGGRILPLGLAMIVIAIITGVSLHFWTHKTRIGLASLAASEDRQAAALRGINVRRLAFGSFVAAGVLAGVVGLLTGPLTYSLPTLGTTLTLSGFVALAAGGFGSYFGSIIGGLLTGLVAALAARNLGANYQQMVVFALLLFILLVKPGGLLGQKELRRA